jgi:hypothetical protein
MHRGLVAGGYEAATSLLHECPIGHFAIMKPLQSATAICVVTWW